MKKYLQGILALLTFGSCVKDKPNSPIQPAVQLSNAKKVYIVNEGNFMAGNSSVSLFDPATSQCIENFYQSQNGNSLGDVAQSISFINSDFYTVINNSNKIVVCDNQFKYKSSIMGFTSPRYILQVSNSKAYVSDLYANKINIVNLNSNSVSGSVACPGWTEKMAIAYSKVFATNIKRNYTYVINVATDQKTDSILVGPGAGDIVVDKNDKVWVLSAGDKTASIVPSLKKIDPLTHTVETTYDFTLNDSPSQLCLNKTKDTLYYLNSGIFKMAIAAPALPASPLIPKGNKVFYGLGVNTHDYTIYASDALDYIQKSVIYIFDSNGNPKSFFHAGVNSNSFYFE